MALVTTYLFYEQVDFMGAVCTEGGDRVDAELLATEGGSIAGSVDVRDNNDGTYHCAYRAYCEGCATLHVRVLGEPIQGSPFAVTLEPPSPAGITLRAACAAIETNAQWVLGAAGRY